MRNFFKSKKYFFHKEKFYLEKGSLCKIKVINSKIFGFDNFYKIEKWIGSRNPKKLYGDIFFEEKNKKFYNGLILLTKDVIIDKSIRRIYFVYIPGFNKKLWLSSIHIED